MAACRWFFQRRREQGAAAMELALLIPIFVLIIVGTMDFGHAWYIHHTITNASREGARFGSRYYSASNARSCPSQAEISVVVKDYLRKFFDPDLVNKVTVTRTLAACKAGENLTVTVSAPKEWIFLGYLVGLGDVTITAATMMKLE